MVKEFVFGIRYWDDKDVLKKLSKSMGNVHETSTLSDVEVRNCFILWLNLNHLGLLLDV